MIRTNPVTGWKSVYVNRGFTKRINGVSKDESDMILAYLFNLVTQVSCCYDVQHLDRILTLARTMTPR